MDIQWLQKDFGVYIVNLFDTYHASHALELESHGLAFLLKYYCDVETNKKFQLADWRIRPLPAEMLKYARMDTHYLLYIYDRMRNEVLSRSPDTKQLMQVVLQRSATTSLNQYVKEVYDAANGLGPNGWKPHLRKCNIPLTAEQVSVFKAVHAWRDRVAREEDESVRYVLPGHMLARIAMEMPSEAAGVRGCCYPVPTFMKLYANDVAILINKTRKEFKEHAEIREQTMKDAQEAEAKRMQEKGVHTRFDDDEDDMTIEKVENDTNSTERQYGAAVVGTHVPKKDGQFRFSATNIPEVVVSVKVARSSYGTLVEGEAHQDDDELDGIDLATAKRIRESLVLTAPGFQLIKKRKRQEEDAAAAKNAVLVDKKAATAKLNVHSIVDVSKSGKNKAQVTNTVSDASNEDVFISKPIPALSGPAFAYPENPTIGTSESGKKTAATKDFLPYNKIEDFGGKKAPKAFKNRETRSLSYK
jgi:exosome complex exonuclease RRP6